jgi:hypothetical protein
MSQLLVLSAWLLLLSTFLFGSVKYWEIMSPVPEINPLEMHLVAIGCASSFMAYQAKHTESKEVDPSLSAFDDDDVFLRTLGRTKRDSILCDEGRNRLDLCRMPKPCRSRYFVKVPTVGWPSTDAIGSGRRPRSMVIRFSCILCCLVSSIDPIGELNLGKNYFDPGFNVVFPTTIIVLVRVLEYTAYNNLNLLCAASHLL